MEDYGSTPSASGIIERAVKLPCEHIVGSECISIWVSAPAKGGSGNNTCPVCRRVLFEVQRPQGLQGPRGPRGPPMRFWWVRQMEINTILVNQCSSLIAQLGLDHNPDITRMARCIADSYYDRVYRIEDTGEIGDGPVHAIAAASIYMASHLLGEATSLEMISSCVTVGDDVIRRAYALIYRHRLNLIDTQLLARGVMELSGIDEVLPSISGLMVTHARMGEYDLEDSDAGFGYTGSSRSNG